MARVDVDTESLVKIRYGLNKLQNVANKGLSDAERALSSIESEIRSVYQQGCSKITTLESEISRLKKQADTQQAEYDQQLKAAEEAKAQGKPYTLPYRTPNDMRNEANEKNKQLNELKRELENLKKQMMQYKASKEVFLDEFKKIASNAGGGDNGQATSVLEKSIATLDEYVHTNISSESCSSYDRYAAQMRADNARNADNTRRINQEEFIRTLNLD